MEQDKKKVSLRQRWSDARPMKAHVFWAWLASVVVIMIIGFTWGGWVTGSSAQKIAEAMAQSAVATRLAPICVVQFKQDPAKDQKLTELKAKNYWERSEYVKAQGWATMPGEERPERWVADECVKLLLFTNP